MLGDTHGRKLDMYVPDYVVFDLETTGINWTVDEVVEISAVKVQEKNIVDTFSSLVNPKMKIPFRASAINHIYDDMVKDAPVFEEVLAEFDSFIGNLVLVGHNIHNFDMKFIQRDADKYWGKTFSNDYIDTLTLARQCLPELSNHKLTDLAAHYQIAAGGAHRALVDCGMNQKIFERLGEALESPKVKRNMKICPRCGQLMQKRSGRYGEFWGCSGYPKCRYTENV